MMRAKIEIDVPKRQITKKVSVIFPDDTKVEGVCVANEVVGWSRWTYEGEDYAICPVCSYGEEGDLLLENITPYCPYCGTEHDDIVNDEDEE